jgi:hypothetical protein
MPSSAPTGAGFIAKERAIQEDFVANFRDKHLAQIEWLGNRRRTWDFRDSRHLAVRKREKQPLLCGGVISVGFTPNCSFDRYLA